MTHTISFRAWFAAVVASAVLIALAIGSRAHAEDGPPQNHVRGQIESIDSSAIAIKTRDGGTVRIALPDKLAVFTLSKANFSSVDFGLYVGSVAVRLDMTSPIVRATPRETISWLYQGQEFRIIDEKLRGIAIGFKPWDHPKGGSMTHGWVDDMDNNRVVSIKYGPTQDEESDVLVGKDVQITRMSPGERSDIAVGAHAFLGTAKGSDGKLSASWIFVGKDGLVPSL